MHVCSIYNTVSKVIHHCWVDKGMSKHASVCWLSVGLDFSRLTGEINYLTKTGIM